MVGCERDRWAGFISHLCGEEMERISERVLMRPKMMMIMMMMMKCRHTHTRM